MEQDGWACQELCFLSRKSNGGGDLVGAQIWPKRLRLLSMEPYSSDDWGEWREVDDGYGDTVSRPTCSDV
uniref:Uncharacterized protein n=1 Tax=Oryza glumipatula TaxID=40148 RepID=A0A0E0B822_9ORYZ